MVQANIMWCPYESLTADSAHHSLRSLITFQITFGFLRSRLENGDRCQSDIDGGIDSCAKFGPWRSCLVFAELWHPM